MNQTIEKFGYPASLVKEFEHWVVLLRPSQVTLGSLVLAAKGNATAYGDLPSEAFNEQAEAVAAIERALRAFTQYERINYLILMMVDPNVHFHAGRQGKDQQRPRRGARERDDCRDGAWHSRRRFGARRRAPRAAQRQRG